MVKINPMNQRNTLIIRNMRLRNVLTESVLLAIHFSLQFVLAMRVIATVFVIFVSTCCIAKGIGTGRSENRPLLNDRPERTLSRDDQKLISTLPSFNERPMRGHKVPISAGIIPVVKFSRPDYDSMQNREEDIKSSSVAVRRKREDVDCYSLAPGVTPEYIVEQCKMAVEVKFSDDSTEEVDFSKLDCKTLLSFLSTKYYLGMHMRIEETNLPYISVESAYYFHNLHIINNPLLEDIKFPSVRTSGIINIEENRKLKAIDLSAKTMHSFYLTNNSFTNDLIVRLDELSSTTILYIEGNPKLKVINLPKLENVTWDLTFNDNEGLKTIEAPNLRNARGLAVMRNAALEELKTPNVSNIYEQDFEIEGNYALKEIWMPFLATITSLVVISDNAKLEAINLGKDIDIDLQCDELKITKNPSLSKIGIGKTENVPLIVIYGNKNLLKKDIDVPNTSQCADCYIQDDNECVFDQPLTDLTDLDGCKNIYGNLTIDPIAKGSTSAQLSTIQADLNITNTPLGIDSFHFLKNTEIKGQFVISGPCITKEQLSGLNVTSESMVFTESDTSCPTTTQTNSDTSAVTERSRESDNGCHLVAFATSALLVSFFYILLA